MIKAREKNKARRGNRGCQIAFETYYNEPVKEVYSPQLQHKPVKWLTQGCQLASGRIRIGKWEKSYRIFDLSPRSDCLSARESLNWQKHSSGPGLHYYWPLGSFWHYWPSLPFPNFSLCWHYAVLVLFPFLISSAPFHLFLSPLEYESPNTTHFLVTILNYAYIRKHHSFVS